MDLQVIVGQLYRDRPDLRGVTDPDRLATALTEASRPVDAAYIKTVSADEIDRAAKNWFASGGAQPSSLDEAKRVTTLSGGRTSATGETASLAEQLLRPWQPGFDGRDAMQRLVRELPHVQRPAAFVGSWPEVLAAVESLGIAHPGELKPTELVDKLMQAAIDRLDSGLPIPAAERTRWLALHHRVAMAVPDSRLGACIPRGEGRTFVGHAQNHGLGREDFASVAAFRVGLMAAVFDSQPGDHHRLDRLLGSHRQAGEFSPAGWLLQFGRPEAD